MHHRFGRADIILQDRLAAEGMQKEASCDVIPITFIHHRHAHAPLHLTKRALVQREREREHMQNTCTCNTILCFGW